MNNSFKDLVSGINPLRRSKIEAEKVRLRREMMSTMAEYSLNPASVTSESQAQVALFMVEQLSGCMKTDNHIQN